MVRKLNLLKGSPQFSLVRRWLFTFNLLFIIYMAVLLGEYLLSPDSGRLSTLVCKLGSHGKSVCTVKIFGIRKIYRQDFYADDYVETLTSYNYPSEYRTPPYLSELALPWGDIHQYDTSDFLVCAVAIRTGPQVIDFIPPYQSYSFCQTAVELIKSAFNGDRSNIELSFNGYNPHIYRLVWLIIAAGLVLLGQSVFYIIRRIKMLNAARKAGEESPHLFSKYRHDLAGILFLDTTQAYPTQPLSRKAFILSWWAATALVALLYIFGLILASQGRRDGAAYACFLSIRDYQSLLIRPILRNLVLILPLVTLACLMAALQWHILQRHFHTAKLWIAAPVIAAVPLLFSLPSEMQCSDAAQLALPFLLPTSDWTATTTLMVIFFILVGAIQWLVLRKSLRRSAGWVIIPFLVALAPFILFVPFFWFFLYFIPSSLMPLTEIIMLPLLVISLPIMFGAFTSVSFLAGYYLYRLVCQRYSLVSKDSPDNVMSSTR